LLTVPTDRPSTETVFKATGQSTVLHI